MSRIFFAILLAIALFSCKKEQPLPSNFNEGCSCAHEVSADFTIEEMTTNNPAIWHFTETDTIYSDKNVRFYANEDNAEYTWYIGSEILYTREVIRFFDISFAGQTIPITLVVKKNANTICFPNDDGYDSIVNYFTVGPELQFPQFFQDTNLRFEGNFRVKSELDSDSIDIIIDIENNYAGVPTTDNLIVLGLKQDTMLVTNPYSYNYNQMWFDYIDWYPGSACFLHSSNIYVKNNEIQLNLYTNGFTDCKTAIYKGRKLN